jgi:hypothetical protein
MDFMHDTLYKAHNLGVRNAEDCKSRSPFLSRAQYKRADCAQDGYTMIKCVSEGARGGVRKTRRSHAHRNKTRGYRRH